MERMILRTLAFDVSSPTVNWFCLYLLKELDATEKACFLALVGGRFIICHCCLFAPGWDW